MNKQALIEQLKKDLAFAKKNANRRPAYWEGAIDVLEDVLRMAQ